jgi:hypothetical protein
MLAVASPFETLACTFEVPDAAEGDKINLRWVAAGDELARAGVEQWLHGGWG